MKRKQSVLFKILGAITLSALMATSTVSISYGAVAGRIIKTRTNIQNEKEDLNENSIVFDFTEESEIP